MERVDAVRVHDLIRVHSKVAARWLDAPAWVRQSLDDAPWVVVRRARVHDTIPVGVRGTYRAERFAAHIRNEDILDIVTPEDLVRKLDRDTVLAAAARAVSYVANANALRWGITGSFGFELASGRRTTNGKSDLDIVVRFKPDDDRKALIAFGERCAEIENATRTSIDAEVDLAVAAVALRELCKGTSRLVAKTIDGPCLVNYPL